VRAEEALVVVGAALALAVLGCVKLALGASACALALLERGVRR